MRKKSGLLLISVCYATFLLGQTKTTAPSAVKVGVFYYYPRGSADSYYIVRNDSVQKDINLTAKDTSIWRINWQNDSVINYRYWTGSMKLSEAQRSFRNAHVVVVKINMITSKYYTFSGGLDSISGIGNTQDTIWFRPRMGSH